MCTMLMHSWVLVVYLLFAPKSLYFDSIDCMLNSARRILLYTLPSVDRVRCTRLLWRQQTNKRNCVQSREKNKRKRVQSDPMDLIGVETECDRASSRLKTNGAWKNKRNWLTQFVAAVFFCARHGEISIDGNGWNQSIAIRCPFFLNDGSEEIDRLLSLGVFRCASILSSCVAFWIRKRADTTQSHTDKITLMWSFVRIGIVLHAQ